MKLPLPETSSNDSVAQLVKLSLRLSASDSLGKFLLVSSPIFTFTTVSLLQGFLIHGFFWDAAILPTFPVYTVS